MARNSKSRSGRSGEEGFSYFDQATREDVGLLTVPALLPSQRFSEMEWLSRADVGLAPAVVAPVAEDLPLWLPLLPPSLQGDERVSARTSRRGREGLSFNHIYSNSPKPTPAKPLAKPKTPARAVVWTDGSAAYIPGIQTFSRAPERETPERGRRGPITSLSDPSRQRIQRFLDTIDRKAIAYSMALTCPGRWFPSWNPFAKECFRSLLKAMTGSRDPIIAATGVFWKQELQKREAIHFHFLFWGLDETQAKHVQRWIAKRWSALVCKGLHPKDAKAHLRWHLHEKNLFVPEDMSRYFAQYLGKDEEAALSAHPIPGRWWGKINSAFIPVSVREETSLTPQASIIAQRVARKLRQSKANEARHYSVCRTAGLLRSNGRPIISAFFMTCSPRHASREAFREVAKFKGVRFGKADLPNYLRTAAVFLSGPLAPATGKRILAYAISRESDDFSGVPF